MVSVKYIAIVLRADDEGEGGTFAVYSLLSRYVRRLFTCLVGGWVPRVWVGMLMGWRCDRQIL